MIEPKESLEKSVLAKIKTEDIKMRPRSYFILRGILLAMSIVIIFLVALYILSFILFIFKESDLWYMPGLGPRGLGIFLKNFPWLLIIVIVIFILALETLVKRYSFAYRQPLLYSVLAIIALIIFMGIIIRQTSFHNRIWSGTEKGHFNLAQPFYKNFGPQPMEGVYPGVVLEITPAGFIIETPTKTVIKVSTSTLTLFPENKMIKIGDRIIIMGDIENEILKAEGIRQRGHRDTRHGLLPPPPPIFSH
jgi:magnesium-transporting ATPase (P-type)